MSGFLRTIPTPLTATRTSSFSPTFSPTPSGFNDTVIDPSTNETITYLNLTTGTSFGRPPAIPTFVTAYIVNSTLNNSTFSLNPNSTTDYEGNSTITSYLYNITFSSWDNSTLSTTSTTSYPNNYGNFDNNPSPYQGAVVVYGPNGGHLTPLGITLVVLFLTAFMAIFIGGFIFFRRRKRKREQKQKWLPGDRILKDGTFLSTNAGFRRPDSSSPSIPLAHSHQRIPSPPSTPVDVFNLAPYDPGAFAGAYGDDFSATPDETENANSSPLSNLSLVRAKLPKVSISGLLPAVRGPPSPRKKPPDLGERNTISPPPKMMYIPTYPPSSFTSSSPNHSAFTLPDGVPTQLISSTPPLTTTSLRADSAWKSESPSRLATTSHTSGERRTSLIESAQDITAIPKGNPHAVAMDYENVSGGYHVW